jgi:hypothetical protein
LALVRFNFAKKWQQMKHFYHFFKFLVKMFTQLLQSTGTYRTAHELKQGLVSDPHRFNADSDPALFHPDPGLFCEFDRNFLGEIF